MVFESDESTGLVYQSPSSDSRVESPLPRPIMMPNMIHNFRSLTQARNCLEYHIESLLNRPRGSFEATYNPEIMLQEWFESLQRYCGPGWPSDIRGLKVHHRTAMVLARTIAVTTEMIYDEYVKDFKYIASEFRDLLENSQIQSSPLFEDVLGLISPLYLVASRCRDPLLRREAISLLRLMHRHEGTHISRDLTRGFVTLIDL
jgi:hypothetical protein